MKVVTIWQKSGTIALVRDSIGDLYTPKSELPAPGNFDLHIPTREKLDVTDIPLPAGVSYFIDSLEDDLEETSNKLKNLLQGAIENRLLIVTASDSIKRKQRLTELAIKAIDMTRILEVSLPISCLSPTLTKGGVSYSDIEARRRTNFSRQDIYSIRSEEPYLTSLDCLTPHVLLRYAENREIWFPERVDGECYLTSEHNYEDGGFYHSQLVPFTLTGQEILANAPSNYSEKSSQNPRHGIVRALRLIKNHESLPPSLVTVQSDVADLRFASSWANNTVCQGSTFGDLRNAELSALGEAYERYCVNIIDTRTLVTGSGKSLHEAGLNPARPADFVLFSQEQIARFEGRFELFDENTLTTWVKGRTFHGEERLVPVSMVFVNHRRLSKFGRYPIPPINAPAYAGISAGQTYTSACINALQEIMERHATMCWWHNPANNPRLSIPKRGPVASLVQEFKAKGNQICIVGIENRFNMPIYAATIFNHDFGIVNTGFGCRPTNEAAILKALTEACILQAGSFDLLNPHGELFMAIERGELWDGIAKPWRADRRYLDYYPSDFSTMNDLMLQQQVYLDQRLLPRVEPWLFPAQSHAYFYEDIHFNSEHEELAFYVSKLQEMGLEPITVDITSPDVRSLQISVIRVVVPGLVPNFAAGDLHLGRMAIQYEPVLLGQQSVPTRIDEINRNPLPHC